jgi:hypothetical protein
VDAGAAKPCGLKLRDLDVISDALAYWLPFADNRNANFGLMAFAAHTPQQHTAWQMITWQKCIQLPYLPGIRALVWTEYDAIVAGSRTARPRVDQRRPSIFRNPISGRFLESAIAEHQ